MKKQLLLGAMALGFISIVGTSCKKDSNNSSTSYSDVKSIIDGNCATSSCHSGTTPSAGKDYTTYAGLKTSLNSGKFTAEVLTDKTMPKGGSLTTAQIDLITTWKDNGYAE